MSALLTIARAALSPYCRNNNTGNKYEIHVILFALRLMGLTDTMLDEMGALFGEIRARNRRAAGDIDQSLAHVRRMRAGRGWVLDGRRVVDLRNVTQDDGDGKTADVVAITETGAELRISICGGDCKADGRVEKCLINPSATRVGASEEDIAWIKARAAAAVVEYKAHMTSLHGADESLWPERQRTPAAVDAATAVAARMEARFRTFDLAQQVAILRGLLHIDDVSSKPADYLAIVTKKSIVPKFYSFEEPVFTHWAPRLVADGIWLNVYNCDRVIGKIQVKFNNGVYHKGETSALHSSWNFTVDLRDIFHLKAATMVAMY